MKDIDRMMLEFGRNAYPAVVEADGMTDEQLRAIQLLACTGLIESFGVYGGYRITNAGMDALRAEEEMVKERTKQKEEEKAREEREGAKQKAKDKRETLFFWLRALLDLLFLIAGALIERNTDVVDRFLSLFK